MSLAGIFLVLCLWAAIGHVLWLLGKAVIQAVFPSSGLGQPRRQARCPNCSRPLHPDDSLCLACGFRLNGAGDTLTELNHVSHRLRRWFQAERIDADQHALLQALVRADRAAARRWQEVLDSDEIEVVSQAETPPATRTEPTVSAGESEAGMLRPHVPAKPMRDRPAAGEAPAGPRPMPPTPKPSRPSEAPDLEKPEVTRPSPTRERAASRPDEGMPLPPSKPAEAPTAAPDHPERSREPRTLTALMSAFMEERNIRWGELISGMLIVGSATGLVISLWSTLDDIPYFPGLLFLLVTAGLHAAGRYTLSRWKLESTSRGLLLISTLLIPLNFLAAIALSENDPSINLPMYITAVAVGVVSFSAISVSASRILMLSEPWLLVGGVMGPCLGQLVLSRLAHPDLSQTMMLFLASLPVLPYLAVMGVYAVRTRHWSHWTVRRTHQTFILLGISLFSLTLALALLFIKTEALRETASTLSPLVSLVASAVVAIGTLVHLQLTGTVLHGQRMMGTAIAILGASLMASAVLLAWPQPDLLIAVAIINFVALSAFALFSHIHPLHIPAIGSVAAAADLAVLLLTGRLDTAADSLEIVRAASSGLSSAVVTATALLAAVASVAVRSRNLAGMARQYARGSALLSLGAAAIASYAGFFGSGDSAWITPVLAINGLAGLAASRRRLNPAVTWLSSGVLLLTSLHGLTQNATYRQYLESFDLLPEYPLAAALLFHAALVTGVSLLLCVFDLRPRRVIGSDGQTEPTVKLFGTAVLEPLCVSAVVTSAAALPQVLLVQQLQFATHALYALWCVAVWLCAAYVLQAKPLFLAGRCLASIAAILMTTAICREMTWWENTYLDSRHLHAQLMALALTGIAWELLRRSLAGLHVLSDLFDERHIFERSLIALATGGLCLVTLVGTMPLVVESFAFAERISTTGGRPQFGIMLMLMLTLVGAAESQARMSGRGWLTILAALAGLVVILGPLDEWCAVWPLPSAFRAHCYGVTSWLALSSCALGVAIQRRWLRCGSSAASAAGLLLAVPFLLAPQFAVPPDALRWLMAAYLVMLGLIRIAVQVRPETMPWTSLLKTDDRNGFPSVIDAALLLVGLAVMGFVSRGVLAALPHLSEGAEAAARWWSLWMLRHGSLSGPLMLLSLTLFAIGGLSRSRSTVTALAWALQLTIFTGMALVLAQELPLVSSAAGWLLVCQRSALALALGGVIWHLGQSWLDVAGGREASQTDARFRLSATLTEENWLTAVQHLLAALGCGVGAAVAVIAILTAPAAPRGDLLIGGTLAGLVTTGVTSGIWLSACRWLNGAALVHVVGATLTTFVIQIAARLANADLGDAWLGFHVLECGILLEATVAVAATAAIGRLRRQGVAKRLRLEVTDLAQPVLVWALVCLTTATLLATGGYGNDPTGVGWSVAILGGATALVVTLALVERSAALAVVSVLTGSVTSFLWHWQQVRDLPAREVQDLIDVELAVGCTMAAMSLLWLGVELWFQRRRGDSFHPERWPRTHTVFAHGLLFIFALQLAVLLASRAVGTVAEVTLQTPWGWYLSALVTALLLGRLWERSARCAVESLWWVSGAWVGFLLDSLAVQQDDLLLALTWMLAAHGFLVSMCVAARGVLSQQLIRLRAAFRLEDCAGSASRLLPAQVALGLVAQAIGFYGITQFADAPDRISVAMAATAGVGGLLILGHTLDRSLLQCLSLVLLATGGTELGWSVMETELVAHLPLLRALRTMVVVGAFAAGYGVFLVRVVPTGSSWRRALHQASAVLSVMTLISLCGVLLGEYWWFVPGTGAPVTGLQIAITAFVLIGLTASLISLAVLPDRDPLRLSERGRLLYVYAAELILALLILHVYLTLPELFTGRLRRYWPFIVMSIAFAGVGVGEWMSRLRLRVLAEPLQRTAAFLPLIPILSLWISGSHGSLSLTLFLCGGLYLALSMLRKSFQFGLGAGLAANAALWVLLHDYGLSLLTRPQMWLIPPALSVLAAAQFNRNRIGEAQLTSIRYLAVTVIYVSSSGEMFVTGVGESLWLPMILAGLSVAGVFAGILMRIRAFLYLGASFLLLSIVSMVWHAAQALDHVWPWWAFGILLGLAILTIFGLFERRRNQMLTVVGELRHWEP